MMQTAFSEESSIDGGDSRKARLGEIVSADSSGEIEIALNTTRTISEHSSTKPPMRVNNNKAPQREIRKNIERKMFAFDDDSTNSLDDFFESAEKEEKKDDSETMVRTTTVRVEKLKVTTPQPFRFQTDRRAAQRQPSSTAKSHPAVNNVEKQGSVRSKPEGTKAIVGPTLVMKTNEESIRSNNSRDYAVHSRSITSTPSTDKGDSKFKIYSFDESDEEIGPKIQNSMVSRTERTRTDHSEIERTGTEYSETERTRTEYSETERTRFDYSERTRDEYSERSRGGTETSRNRTLDRLVSTSEDGDGYSTGTGEEGLTDEEDSYSTDPYSVRSEYSTDNESEYESMKSADHARQGLKEEQLINNESTLVEIELGHDSMRRHLPLDLVEAIQRNSYLQRLTLNQSNCDPVNFEILFDGLFSNRSIVQLELSRVDITRETGSELASALGQNDTVKKLCLKKCKFVKAGLPILFMGLQHNKSIQHLVIESCDLGGHLADIVTASIPLLNLVSVRFHNTHLSQEAISFLFQSMEKTPALESINLTGERISLSSMELLSDCIEQCDKLKKISLVDCGLKAESLEVFVEGVKKNDKIQDIDVSRNNIGDEGADILIDLLKDNSKIIALNTEKCHISRNEKRLLKDSLRYNNTFLKNMFSAEVTMSILDTVGLIQNAASKDE